MKRGSGGAELQFSTMALILAKVKSPGLSGTHEIHNVSVNFSGNIYNKDSELEQSRAKLLITMDNRTQTIS